MVTTDSQRNPYVCVFEDAPKGFPIGDNLSERVVFNGYFLKLMKYQSGQGPGLLRLPAPDRPGRLGGRHTAEARGPAGAVRLDGRGRRPDVRDVMHPLDDRPPTIALTIIPLHARPRSSD